jgi:ParB family chromosome partitioning protein
MSLRDKASKIDFGSLPGMKPGETKPANPSPAKPKTAPGLMMAQTAERRSELLQENDNLKAQVATLSEAASRAAELQEELSAWDGAKATRLLDPRHIMPSEWANRDQCNFTGPDFEQLKEEIASAGGNVQAIKVRAVRKDGELRYEVIFGHRRHRACLELGLPVLCVIDNLSDEELFIQMDRENRNRKNLSPWEQGVMYQRALERGLFPSNRRLAERVGVDLSLLGKALMLARLPKQVIEAFASPLDLQFRWAKALSDAAASDPEGLLKRAEEAKALGDSRPSSAVIELLLAQRPPQAQNRQHREIVLQRKGKSAARIMMDPKGQATVSFMANVIDERRLPELKNAIEAFLSKLDDH